MIFFKDKSEKIEFKGMGKDAEHQYNTPYTKATYGDSGSGYWTKSSVPISLPVSPDGKTEERETIVAVNFMGFPGVARTKCGSRATKLSEEKLEWIKQKNNEDFSKGKKT